MFGWKMDFENEQEKWGLELGMTVARVLFRSQSPLFLPFFFSSLFDPFTPQPVNRNRTGKKGCGAQTRMLKCPCCLVLPVHSWQKWSLENIKHQMSAFDAYNALSLVFILVKCKRECSNPFPCCRLPRCLLAIQMKLCSSSGFSLM